MANTPFLNLPQNSNWTSGEVEAWAKLINDENATTTAFKLIDAFAQLISQRVDNFKASYPISGTLDAWNIEFRAGTVTPDITLPTPALQRSEEIRYIFVAASASAEFTPPSGYMLADEDGFAGIDPGDTLAYTNLTVGSIYEVSFVVIDSTHIGMLTKEWKTA